jgi:hypothetical protein
MQNIPNEKWKIVYAFQIMRDDKKMYTCFSLNEIQWITVILY